MASTYTPIATTTLGSDAASYTFSSIPSTYTDVILIGSLGSTNTSQTLAFRVNGDTASNYSSTNIIGNGSTAFSHYATNQTWGTLTYDIGVTGTVGGCLVIASFQNYANTTTYKTTLARANQTDATYNGAEASVSLWRSTAAINSITAIMQGGNIKAGSTFTLYGIKAA